MTDITPPVPTPHGIALHGVATGDAIPALLPIEDVMRQLTRCANAADETDFKIAFEGLSPYATSQGEGHELLLLAGSLAAVQLRASVGLNPIARDEAETEGGAHFTRTADATEGQALAGTILLELADLNRPEAVAAATAAVSTSWEVFEDTLTELCVVLRALPTVPVDFS
jgi:hypothetical protein